MMVVGRKVGVYPRRNIMVYLIIAAEYFTVASPVLMVLAGVAILVKEHLENKALQGKQQES